MENSFTRRQIVHGGLALLAASTLPVLTSCSDPSIKSVDGVQFKLKAWISKKPSENGTRSLCIIGYIGEPVGDMPLFPIEHQLAFAYPKTSEVDRDMEYFLRFIREEKEKQQIKVDLQERRFSSTRYPAVPAKKFNSEVGSSKQGEMRSRTDPELIRMYDWDKLPDQFRKDITSFTRDDTLIRIFPAQKLDYPPINSSPLRSPTQKLDSSPSSRGYLTYVNARQIENSLGEIYLIAYHKLKRPESEETKTVTHKIKLKDAIIDPNKPEDKVQECLSKFCFPSKFNIRGWTE